MRLTQVRRCLRRYETGATIFVGLRFFGEPPRRAFWQARFYDFNVWSEKKRVEKLNYMHGNPVKRALVESPEQWGWSSYRHYFLGEVGPVQVNVGWGEISFRDHAA